ncbi:surfactin synthetase subunit 3 [Apiospora marii]|uniref:Surfactin synthetase subunit 3 n=1 Tax=Apiospora marii TaxID=335849 RepID=A0ABR1SH81_9PEZI
MHTATDTLGAEVPSKADKSIEEKQNPQSNDDSNEHASVEDLVKIWQWNTPVPPALQTCMQDFITEQAQRDPERAAVNSWDGDFTYGEVERLSTRLAHHLVSIGVGAGVNVPLCFEKSRWTVIGVLAIMKAGGTFALTDPSQPEGRLRQIVDQTGAAHILTSASQKDLGQRIAPQAHHVVVSAEEMGSYDSAAATTLPVVAPATNLYIQFTSGSTGKPKGVLVTHENYTSGAVPRADLVGYRPHSRVLDFASYAFDVCIDCMLCTLANGGCLCIPSEADRINDLSGAICKMQVNMAHMTPSVARVLEADVIPSLEVLGLGGEAISNGDGARWSKSTTVVNAYGPSECTVGCTINNQVGRDGKEQVTIGKGVGGSTWIVDPEDHDRLVPVGAVGELLIEGPIVGPGYLGDTEKTSVVFINNPKFLSDGCQGAFPGRSGRLYKTGDLVKYDVDGSIIFVGRGDQQVKLRGQRIELAEIEHHMRDQLPAGTRVAAEVIKPGGSAGEPTLVAFISDKAGLVPATEELLGSFNSDVQKCLAGMNSLLSEYLPTYMVPAAYLPLQTMPLLVSAKTDRKRLRELGASMSRRDISAFAAAVVPRKAPSTEMEKQLARLWGEVLGPDVDIGAADNFFSLGGDSLRAMKLVAAARKERVSLSVADIFGNPVLSEMAAAAKTCDAEENLTVPPFSLLPGTWALDVAKVETSAVCGINPEDVQDIYPCSPLQEGLMALSAKVSEAYVAQRVVEMQDLESAQRLAKAFEVAAADCAILRTRIVQISGQGLMQIVVREAFSCPVKSGCTLSDYLAEDRNDPIQLGGTLVRYAIVTDEKETGKTYFVLTMHHALYDGWAMPLIVERVNKAYQGMAVERPANFNNFIKFLFENSRQESEDYWRQRLDGAGGEQFPPLPYQGYQQKADSLLEHYVGVESRLNGTTIATAIRGAWALLVASYTASSDVVFGETLTGRNAPIAGVEQIEGPMIATIPVRVSIDRDTTVSEYLQYIHQDSVRGIPHEHFGLQHIRRLSPDAREACELRTGLVLHPSADAEEAATAAANKEAEPANAFVPASDEEAAQEALKFNTYALMLVCSLDPKGFLIMASFDSQTVQSGQMQRMLAQLGRLVQQFCEAPGKRIAEIRVNDDGGLGELQRLSKASVESLGQLSQFADTKAAEVWLADPLNPEHLVPIGATGELILGSVEATMPFEAIEVPSWISVTTGQTYYRTQALAKLKPDGSLQLVDRAKTAAVNKAQSSAVRTTRVSASSDKQRKLSKAWSRILGVPEEEIGLEDSFFLLGGDSIGAMKLVAEARAEGFELTVANVFKYRTLYDMASALKETKAKAKSSQEYSIKPLSLLKKADPSSFVAQSIQPLLANPDWAIKDVYPTRPLQHVAVNGTVRFPRYSARYELLHMEGGIDKYRLVESCQELIKRNEILRTVFVETDGQCFGVVLESMTAEVEHHVVEEGGDMASFTKELCDRDIQTEMPHGSAFVKFLTVQHGDATCLALRISHSQYDEICLVALLRQLNAIYDGRSTNDTVPFSNFVYHTVETAIPESVPYWRELLKGSKGLSILRPDIPLTGAGIPDAVTRTISIAARQRDITVATLPTAAWALCLARRLKTRDVVFGEVVSGRHVDLPGGGGADAVMGPTWQYVPMRVQFGGPNEDSSWTGLDLLRYVQHQHIAGASHEGMGLREIVLLCTDWPAPASSDIRDEYWFDSVVHQDVYHVETMRMGGVPCRLETVYPHYEPLREWKIQAFVQGDELMFEVVTFKEWIGVAEELLDELEGIMEGLVRRPEEVVFS